MAKQEKSKTQITLYIKKWQKEELQENFYVMSAAIRDAITLFLKKHHGEVKVVEEGEDTGSLDDLVVVVPKDKESFKEETKLQKAMGEISEDRKEKTDKLYKQGAYGRKRQLQVLDPSREEVKRFREEYKNGG